MAIDLQKMRAKLAALSGGGSKSKSSFWRPQDGEQQIRIVPTPDGDPFKNYHFHYNLGNNAGFLCPKKNFGDDCPVCVVLHPPYTARALMNPRTWLSPCFLVCDSSVQS